MKNCSCSCHIQRDGKDKLKEHGFGFLENGTNYTQVFVSQLSVKCVNQCYEYVSIVVICCILSALSFCLL